MPPPPLPGQIHALHAVKERVQSRISQGGKPPLVVFGLDGTLFDPRPRTERILHDYAAGCRQADPDLADRLDGALTEQVRPFLRDTLRALGVIQPSAVRDITNFWHARYHADDYLALDAPTEGAALFVRGLVDAGAVVAYVTGRDVNGMLVGTVQALRDRGFPVCEPNVQLCMKPDATVGDETWKRLAMRQLVRIGEVVGVFESDPGVANLAVQYFPEATVGLRELWPAPAMEHPGVASVLDFRAPS